MKLYSLALLLGLYAAEASRVDPVEGHKIHHGIRKYDNLVGDLATDSGSDLLTTFTKIYQGRTDEVIDSIKPEDPEVEYEGNRVPLVQTFDYESGERGLDTYLMTKWMDEKYGLRFRILGDFTVGWNMPVYSGEEGGREMFVVNP